MNQPDTDTLITQSKIAAVVLNSVAIDDSVMLATITRCFMRLRHFRIVVVKPYASRIWNHGAAVWLAPRDEFLESYNDLWF